MAIITVGFVAYVRLTTKPVIYSGLSDRAKDYLKLKRDSNDREWQNSTLAKPRNTADATVKSVDDDKCFAVKIPIPASELRKEAECQYHFFLVDPVGDAMVFKRAVEAASLQDVADISMRRVYTDQYSEKEINLNGRNILTFKKKEGGYERSAFILENKQLYVFSVVIQTNENLDAKFDEMLKSIKIYNE
jgi:hypothetical protein